MSDEHILDNVLVRPIRQDESRRWDSYMRQYHYLGLRWLGGKSLRYIALLDGAWVALLGWGSAAKNCGARDGHPLYLAETFVDESRFKGICYKASNWKHVGYTEGYCRSNRRYYYHGQVKAVYIYSLCKKGCEILSGDLIPYLVSKSFS
jgi:hypothetical protein